jgi:hypothetical protein
MAVRTVARVQLALIQSVTVLIFQSGPLPRVPVVVQHVGNSDIGLAIFIAVP